MKIFLVVFAYLLGSVSFSILIVKLIAHRDIRTEGSGNAGATNVLRLHGKWAGVAVGLLDVGKGALAVWLMTLVTGNPRWLAAAALAVILGHVFPLFFGFRGGKGVATTAGAFVVLVPWGVVVILGIFALVLLITRYVSAASMIAIASLPPVSLLLFHVAEEIAVAEAAAAIIVILKHHENIRRLVSGQERRLGKK